MKKGLPITLILLGLMLLSGCLFVPAFNRVERGINLADKVGPANSNRPLRVSKVTMAQVLALLGPPLYASEDGRRIAYTWDVLNGYWVFPLCFSAEPQSGVRGIQLEFDSNDVLRSYEIKKLDGSLNLWPAAIVDTRQMFPGLHLVPPSSRFRMSQPTTKGQSRE